MTQLQKRKLIVKNTSHNEKKLFTNKTSLNLFDINSAKIKRFNAGTKFKVNSIEGSYNDFYKTHVYHVRFYEKNSGSICIFTCSKKDNSNEITVYGCESNYNCLSWNILFKEECPIK